MQTRLGVVVIGQSPRPDVVRQMQCLLGDDVQIDVRGSLDGMTRAEIGAIMPSSGADTLFTRLPPDCEDVVISRRVVEERAKAQIERFVREGATVTMLCCTGEFPALGGDGLVVLPSAVLSGIVDGLLPNGRLGVLLPLPEQVEELCAKWRRAGREVVSVNLIPSADEGTIDAASRALNALNPNLVVMDCMSYTKAMKDRVRQTVRAPVILGIAATARIVAELLE